MFRCYFIEDGRISWGDDLTAPALAEAIECSQDLRQASSKRGKRPGIEIWRGASLVYQDVYDTDRIRSSAPIVSPFDTPDSTIYATWRPSQARPLMAQVEVFT